jgi:DNA (cytosine-5)-methyltransferase 1
VSAYYNEHDPFAAAWLRELIADGLIAPGEVDERSIEDVRPDELAGFVQCHFFAGIGIWSLALRGAGWPDDEPVWTGSCPCQPFSAAGKGGGFDDERHLWPAFHWLIDQCAPPIVLGEQVASSDGLAWLDLVSADLEASSYAFGAVDTCAAGFGAPHIRQRLYWMADTVCGRTNDASRQGVGTEAAVDGSDRHLPRQRQWSGIEGEPCSLADAAGSGQPRSSRGGGTQDRRASKCGLHGWLADTDGRNASAERQPRGGEQRQQPQDGSAGGVGNAAHQPRERDAGQLPEAQAGQHGARLAIDGDMPVGPEYAGSGMGAGPGPLNGLWRAADWLCCTDGKWRPVAPGTFPLAPAGTVRNRVGTLRGAGNAINLAQAQGFIEAVIDMRSARGRRLVA